MIVKNIVAKLLSAVLLLTAIFAIVFSYLFFEKSITEKVVTITVINKEKFANEEGKYLIFSPNEVFENSDSFFYKKTNADILFKKLERGVTYRVKVVGIYLPFFNRFRNITEIISVELKNSASN